jgi:hypothetical protein
LPPQPMPFQPRDMPAIDEFQTLDLHAPSSRSRFRPHLGALIRGRFQEAVHKARQISRLHQTSKLLNALHGCDRVRGSGKPRRYASWIPAFHPFCPAFCHAGACASRFGPVKSVKPI